MKIIFKLFGAFVLTASVCVSVTSCRGTYPTSFVHADAINFGDNVNANFNTETYDGKPFNLYVEKEVATDAASAFNQRKKQNDGENVFAELEKEIKSANPQSNTAGIFAMDVALRRVKHMQKEYNKDINVKYTLVYITDGLDNISVQAAKNHFTFPQKKNYRTPDKYKKKMVKRIKHISRYKKDVKNKFDIYPIVFTGSDLGLVEGEIILGKLKDICAKEKIDIKNLTKKDIAFALKRRDHGYVDLTDANKIHRWAQDSIKLDIPEKYIARALEESRKPFDEFINDNMKWLRGSSRGMKDNECPQIIYSNDFDEIKKDFETEFATSSFEFEVPKGYIKQDVKMTMYDSDNNAVDIQGTLQKTLFGKYYLKNVTGSENFKILGMNDKGRVKKIKAINKNKKYPLARFVVTKPQLVDGEIKKPFIVIDDLTEQSYKGSEDSFWVDNSEYEGQSSAEVKTYVQLIYDCSRSLGNEMYNEQKVLIEIADIVRESSKIEKVLK